MNKIKYTFVCILLLTGYVNAHTLIKTSSPNDLVFSDLAKKWDEAMPLGNGTIGALIWENNQALRIALDRSDLWDLRPLEEFKGEPYTFQWVYEHVKKNNYKVVQDWYDFGKKGYAWPTKIPGAALEFDISKLGEIKENRLFLNQAICQIEWKNGVKFQSFIHATEPVGWFIFENIENDFIPVLIPPTYTKGTVNNVNDHSAFDLTKLGYKEGKIIQEKNKLVYEQTGWNNFKYKVAINWLQKGNTMIGTWSITTSKSTEDAEFITKKALNKGLPKSYDSHTKWWKQFYAQSSIDIPDSTLEKQYYNELYKMGCIARYNSYPISLQSIWTADNGCLAPWKGDYHHDLNTQLSYWPFYTGNHLKEGYGYLNTLWNQRKTNKSYTKHFYGTNGLNVPGVCTLEGEPMGGWIQFSLGPTVSAWLSQHFYLHWKYSMDRTFLKERAYPYIKDVATYLEEFTQLKNGIRTLPLSSSPEYNDNRIDAWFTEMSNFDRALIHFVFMVATELASELNLPIEATHWKELLNQLPDFDLDKNGGLTIAPHHPYVASHRHFSHLLAIHPLGIIDKSNGEKDAHIINESIRTLDTYGSDWWCGYSFSWLANLKARALDGDGAVHALHDFANHFCLRNTFHANGDQTQTGKSKFTYRPFTLEGNMAFAAGVQELLLQSHTGIIHIFPAIPSHWDNVSFKKLRAYGAFLVSAKRSNGKVSQISIHSEKGGTLRLKNPFSSKFDSSIPYQINKNIIEIKMKEGESLTLKAI